LNRINTLDYEALYEKSFRWVMRHQPAVWGMVFILLLAAMILYTDLPRSKLPPVTKDETLVSIDWNQRINVEENNKRVQALVSAVSKYTTGHTSMVGEQQYLLDRESEAGATEALIYMKANTPSNL